MQLVMMTKNYTQSILKIILIRIIPNIEKITFKKNLREENYY